MTKRSTTKRSTTNKTSVATAGELFPNELVSYGRRCNIDGNIEAMSGLPFEKWKLRLNDSDVLRDRRGRVLIAKYQLVGYEAIENETTIGPDTELYADNA